MCEIAGIFQSTERPSLRQNCQRMIDAIPHRGPDDNSTWQSEKLNLALGHARLSIPDRRPSHADRRRWIAGKMLRERFFKERQNALNEAKVQARLDELLALAA